MDADARDKMNNQELISALADGQLAGEDFARGVQAAAADARSREAWHAYHVVGEVLRTGRASAGAAPEAFLAKLQARLREEAVLAPVAAPRRVVVPMEREAANDWRWKVVAGVASVAAVAAIGLNVSGLLVAGNGGQQAQLAVAAPAGGPALAQASAPMIRDPRLDALLAAHRQYAGATALATSSGFLRNATFEGPAR
jgi:sigma-E factor negative regulatory protein RseA